MSDLPCNLDLSLLPGFGQEEVTFRTDILIPQPILLGPVDNAHICLPANRQAASQILLTWTISTGANLYVLQWSDSQEMQGGSVRQVLTASPNFTLVRNRDIQVGQTIYWRVFAINITTGGVSIPSVARQLTYACPQRTGGLPNTASAFNVVAELIGPEVIRHCEDTTYYIKMTYTGRDADNREVLQYNTTTWEATFVEPATGEILLREEVSNDLKRYLNARIDGLFSANITLKATITFQDLINNEPYTQEVTKEILAEPFTFGCGLICDQECVSSDPADQTFRVRVDLDEIAGDGLTAESPIDPESPPESPEVDPCSCKKLNIDIGCHLKFDTDKRVAVDLDSLAGPGITVVPGEDGACDKLSAEADYTAGCGISIVDQEIRLNPSDYTLSGTYSWSDTNCPSGTTLTGCSTGSGLAGTVGIAEAQGRVYRQTVGDCHYLFTKVNIPYNCTLEIDNGNLGLNFGIVGAGLTVIDVPDGCPQIGICADTLEADPAVNVATCLDGASDLDQCSLSSAEKGVVYGKVYHHPPTVPEAGAGSCGELVVKSVLPVGCHFNLTNGKIELDLTALAGANLSIDNSGSCPKLQADLGDLTPCELPQILGLCDAPVVTPTTSMFVLGLNPTGPGECCIVKFAITECPPPGGEPEPDPGPI